MIEGLDLSGSVGSGIHNASEGFLSSADHHHVKEANTLKNSGSKYVTNLTLSDANKYRECGESRRCSSCIYSILITVVPKRYVIKIKNF